MRAALLLLALAAPGWSAGITVVPATEAYLSTSTAGRRAIARQKLEGAPEPVVAFTWDGGGDLWRLNRKETLQLESWSADKLRFIPEGQGGRVFGFLGAQKVMGDVESTGINARLGTTLFRDRYDAAVTFGHTSIDFGAGSADITTIGLMGRALFRMSDSVGWNVGGQVLRATGSGVSETTTGLLAGISFYLPGGSFDITAQMGNHSTYGLLVGYTFFLTRP